MSYRQRTARSAVLVTGLGWFLLYVCVLLTALYFVGTDSGLYYRLQLRADVIATSGMDEDQVRAADQAMADYLRGDPDALAGSPFSADEITHMRDCFELFSLLRIAIIGALIPGIAMLCVGIGGMRYCGKAAGRVAAACFLLPLIAIAAYAYFDFDRAFELFHRMLFTNELWLMDPETSLMIRICPESMFSTMACMIFGITVVFILITDLLRCERIRRKRRQKDARI